MHGNAGPGSAQGVPGSLTSQQQPAPFFDFGYHNVEPVEPASNLPQQQTGATKQTAPASSSGRAASPEAAGQHSNANKDGSESDSESEQDACTEDEAEWHAGTDAGTDDETSEEDFAEGNLTLSLMMQNW